MYVVLILRFEFSAASMDVPTSCPSTPKWNLDRPFLTGCFHQVSHLSLSVCLYCNEHESVSIYYIFFLSYRRKVEENKGENMANNQASTDAVSHDISILKCVIHIGNKIGIWACRFEG